MLMAGSSKLSWPKSRMLIVEVDSSNALANVIGCPTHRAASALNRWPWLKINTFPFKPLRLVTT